MTAAADMRMLFLEVKLRATKQQDCQFEMECKTAVSWLIKLIKLNKHFEQSAEYLLRYSSHTSNDYFFQLLIQPHCQKHTPFPATRHS